VLVFKRVNEAVEIENAAWAEIIVFLQKCGWKPSVPAYFFLATNYTVQEEDATSLAAAGQVVLEEALRDPFASYSAIRFDVGKFAEVIEFARGGAFAITERR
jgi:hypothetical protein